MDGAWVDRLERRIGFLAAPDLPRFVTGMTVVVAVLALFKPEFLDALSLHPDAVRHGQVWRLLTYMAIPNGLPHDLFSALWLALWVWFLFGCLQTLEHVWGDFKLTVFLVLAAMSTAAASLWTGTPMSNAMPILACFLALTRVDPERIVIIYFFPVKMRWLANIAWLWLGSLLVRGYSDMRPMAIAVIVPYLLFFWGGHRQEWGTAWRQRGRPR